MMRLRNVVTAALLTAALALCQTAAGADLPPEVRTSSNPDAGPIGAYVKSQFDLINKGDSKARDELCRQVEPTPQIQVSAAFQIVFVQAVQGHLAPMLKDKEITKRLNGAIIVYRLGNATHSPELQDEAVLLCNDASPAIALWGVKSAGTLLPSVMSIGMNIPRQQLTPAIVKAAQNHSTSGPVVQDAYVALDLSTVTPALPAPAINVCTNAIADIVRMRINIGIARMPASPQVDLQATNYFAKGSVLGAAGAIEKLKMVQCLLDLACVNAQRCAETSNNDERKNLQDAASFCGGSLKVILLDAKSPAAGAMDPIIKIHQVSPAAAEGIVRAAVGPLKTVFNQLTDPPKVTPRQQAATAP